MGHASVLVVAADGVHLVLHQRDERADHQGHPVHHQGRKLVAHGFAATGRHDHKCVTSVQHAEDGMFLLTLEFVESKKRLQRLLGRQIDQAHRLVLALR